MFGLRGLFPEIHGFYMPFASVSYVVFKSYDPERPSVVVIADVPTDDAYRPRIMSEVQAHLEVSLGNYHVVFIDDFLRKED